MKKTFFALILFVISYNVYALNDFQINPSEIDINDKGNNLISDLNAEYKIDTKNFTQSKEDTKKAKEYTKKIIDIIFSKDKYETKRKKMLDEEYINPENGFETLTSSITIENFIEELDSLVISYEYIKQIDITIFDFGVLSTVYLPNVKTNDGLKNLLINFYLKENNGYKIYMPWYTTGENIEKYFSDLATSEDNGNNVGGSFNSITLENQEKFDSSFLQTFYNSYAAQNVSVSALKDADVNSYGSGFFIRPGVVVTTWTLFLKILNNSEVIYVNDPFGNVYSVEGVIAADTTYDIVILKINEEKGQAVKLTSTPLKTGEGIFTITSKNNSSFSVNYGNNISTQNDSFKNLFTLTNSDEGSALYNKAGEVVAFNTSSIINNTTSIANSTKYLTKLQNILNDTAFTNIKTTSLASFKEKYYYDYAQEKEINNVPKNIWNKYKTIGDLEKNITLKLIKANYTDHILSLRYKNNIQNSINSLYLSANYQESLKKEGYKLTYETATKKIYENKKYQIIIKENLDYLIIIIKEQ